MLSLRRNFVGNDGAGRIVLKILAAVRRRQVTKVPQVFRALTSLLQSNHGNFSGVQTTSGFTGMLALGDLLIVEMERDLEPDLALPQLQALTSWLIAARRRNSRHGSGA